MVVAAAAGRGNKVSSVEARKARRRIIVAL
jgi:hypothetical protein